MAPVAEDRRTRVRVTGIVLFLAGIASGIGFWMMGSERGVQMDALGSFVPADPLEYVLGGAALLILVLGGALILRARD